MNWDILSRRAKRAISIARKEARSAKNRFLYPEHLCIGLLHADEDISNELIAQSVDIKNIVEILLHMVQEKELRDSSISASSKEAEIALSSEVKEILEKAAQKTHDEFRGQIDIAGVFTACQYICYNNFARVQCRSFPIAKKSTLPQKLFICTISF
jgi:ATP-dependent Clp protease ATP-binding subunit ClpA